MSGRAAVTAERAMMRCQMQGELTKRGGLVKSWKKRLFVLTDSHLMYFQNAQVRGWLLMVMDGREEGGRERAEERERERVRGERENKKKREREHMRIRGGTAFISTESTKCSSAIQRERESTHEKEKELLVIHS